MACHVAPGGRPNRTSFLQQVGNPVTNPAASSPLTGCGNTQALEQMTAPSESSQRSVPTPAHHRPQFRNQTAVPQETLLHVRLSCRNSQRRPWKKGIVGGRHFPRAAVTNATNAVLETGRIDRPLILEVSSPGRASGATPPLEARTQPWACSLAPMVPGCTCTLDLRFLGPCCQASFSDPDASLPSS